MAERSNDRFRFEFVFKDEAMAAVVRPGRIVNAQRPNQP